MNKIIRWVIVSFVLAAVVAVVCAFRCCGDDKNHDDIAGEIWRYLSDVSKASDSYGAVVEPTTNGVSMGGKDFYGCVILGDTEKNNDRCGITFPIDVKIKNISFYLGSTHYSKSYFDSFETVYVYADDRLVFKKAIYNHDLPEYFILPTNNASSVTFKTNGENIVAAIGELKAWYVDDVPKNDDTEEKSTSKLMYHIKPYYLWGKDNIDCIYSQNAQSGEVNGKTYTDAIEFYLPEIEKWSNENHAYFNIEGKYSHLNFDVDFEVADGVVDDVFATLFVYSDGKLLLSEDFSNADTKSFSLSVENCKKLCFKWESIPSAPSIKIIMTNIYVE